MDDRTIAGGMRPNRPTLDEDSASRLLQGLVHPDDAPPGYASVAGLLVAAAQQQQAMLDEDAAATTVSAMVEAIRAGAPSPRAASSRRKSIAGKLFAGKALAAFGIVALTATGAAATTGHLPDPVQGAVANAVTHVGFDLPQPGEQGKSADHRQDAGQPQDVDHGQAGQGQPGAHGQGQGQQISDIADDARDDGQPVGPTVSDAASDGKSHAGEDHPTETTVGSGDESGTVSPDPAGHDATDDHGAVVTPPTAAPSGTPATGEDHSGPDSGGDGSSGRREGSSQH